MALDGIVYDGQSAHRQPVGIEHSAEALTLTYADGFREDVPRSVLKRLDDDAGAVRIGRSDMSGWRLLVAKAEAEPLLTLVGKQQRYGSWIDRFGLLPAAAVAATLTAAVLVVGHAAPHWIAPHVPQSWERNLGTAIVGDFGDNRCRNPAGQRALEAMIERLEPGATSGEQAIDVAALDIGILNAAALPGRHIVIFKPMITEAENMDAVAGIVAHEIAHVRRRHVTEALIRELGIGALIRLFAGDIGANAEQLVALSYTREHEEEADRDAIEMLKRAGISPKPTAELFRRLSSEQGDGSGWGEEFLSSHPLSEKRAKLFESSFDPKRTYTPVLNRDHEDALYNVCAKLPERSGNGR